MKRFASLCLTLTLALASLSACGAKDDTSSGNSGEAPVTGTVVELSDQGITMDGEAAGSDSAAPVYVANDIVYYEEGKDFTYGEGSEADAHSAAEAEGHTVVHITQPGTYILSGQLSQGQVAVDLGDGAEEDPEAVVTLVLNGVDITCTVAPAVIFYNVYECGSTDTETASETVDTSAAGANVIIADGSTNTVNGAYVARIYKSDSVVLSEDGTKVEEAKKLHKYDGAFYSKMSMNVNGGEADTGVLNINAENEGLDSELHLTINGGNINICSGNDGINTNEDGVSVTTINGGTLTIDVDGATGEGDGIDSNGWLVINGGTVISAACANSQDAGIDSDMGIYLNGGTVAASGNMMDHIAGGENYVVFSFAQKQSGGTTYSLKNADGNTVGEWTPANDFIYLVVSGPDLTAGTYTLWQGETQLAGSSGQMGGFGGGGMMGGGMPGGGMGNKMPGEGQMPEGTENFEEAVREKPEDMELPEGMEMPEGMEPPEGMELPEGMERPEGGMEQRPSGGQRPEDAFQPNEYGTVTMPDGTAIDPAEMEPSRGQGGGRQPGGFGGQMGGGELSAEFEITGKGDTFSNISVAQ